MKDILDYNISLIIAAWYMNNILQYTGVMRQRISWNVKLMKFLITLGPHIFVSSRGCDHYTCFIYRTSVWTKEDGSKLYNWLLPSSSLVTAPVSTRVHTQLRATVHQHHFVLFLCVLCVFTTSILVAASTCVLRTSSFPKATIPLALHWFLDQICQLSLKIHPTTVIYKTHLT